MYRLTPKEEIGARIAALRRKLVERGLDAAVIVQNADLFYFAGSIQQGILVVPATGEPVYFARRIYERAVAESPIEMIVKISSPREIPPWFELNGMSFRAVGFEMDVMPVATFRRYAALFPGARTEDLSPAIRELRAVKSRFEVDAVRSCGRKLSALLDEARNLVQLGMTEMELMGILQGRAIADGHTTVTRMHAWNQEMGLGCVISGPDSAVPSYADFPTAGQGTSPYVPVGQGYRAFGKDEPILVDFMWGQDGYIVDMARTYTMGALPEKMVIAHELAKKILRNIEGAIRPGAVAGDLYAIGKEIASQSPFGANFMGPPGYDVKFIGHGIGIEADEFPFIATGSKTVLAAGMVFAMEPKFVFPNEGAVGLENSYLVDETGFEKLTHMDEEIIVCANENRRNRGNRDG